MDCVLEQSLTTFRRNGAGYYVLLYLHLNSRSRDIGRVFQGSWPLSARCNATATTATTRTCTASVHRHRRRAAAFFARGRGRGRPPFRNAATAATTRRRCRRFLGSGGCGSGGRGSGVGRRRWCFRSEVRAHAPLDRDRGGVDAGLLFFFLGLRDGRKHQHAVAAPTATEVSLAVRDEKTAVLQPTKGR